MAARASLSSCAIAREAAIFSASNAARSEASAEASFRSRTSRTSSFARNSASDVSVTNGAPLLPPPPPFACSPSEEEEW